MIERNAQAQGQLVEDLLDVSRITMGKVRLEVRHLLAATPLQEALEAIKPAADAKNIELVATFDRKAGTILGDAARLQQVFWNILTNAVRFTGSGGHIGVALVRREKTVDVVVSDDGIGIDRAFLPFVFEAFRQADARSTREHGGLGLGLAISKELVELHGGTIEVASEGPGRGATFTVHLPGRTAGW